MEVLIGGAVVGISAWLARKLHRLKHMRRNRRFLARQQACEGSVLSTYSVQPALLQAAYGNGSYDHPAFYEAAAQLTDGQGTNMGPHMRRMSAPPDLPTVFPQGSGFSVEELDSRQWEQEYVGHNDGRRHQRLLTAL